MNFFKFSEDKVIPFMKFRKLAGLLSGIGVLASLFLFFVIGVNYGIDFKGGSLIEIADTKHSAADLSNIRSLLKDLDLGDIQVQSFGSPQVVLIKIEGQENGLTEEQVVLRVQSVLSSDIYNYRRIESVGPVVSSELALDGLIAVLVALVGIMIYIWLRFEINYALGAVVALSHDLIFCLGAFVVTGYEFNLSSIAALLTVVGYSLNDTVVVFDRVRSLIVRNKNGEVYSTINRAISQTLSRTILTSVTTAIALLALYVFGGAVVRSFTFSMLFGVLVGTYSSIFIASPVVALFRQYSKKLEENVISN